MAVTVRREGQTIVLETELGEITLSSEEAAITALVLGWEAAKAGNDQATAPAEALDAEPIPTEIVVDEPAEEPAAPEETTDEVVS